MLPPGNYYLICSQTAPLSYTQASVDRDGWKYVDHHNLIDAAIRWRQGQERIATRQFMDVTASSYMPYRCSSFLTPFSLPGFESHKLCQSFKQQRETPMESKHRSQKKLHDPATEDIRKLPAISNQLRRLPSSVLKMGMSKAGLKSKYHFLGWDTKSPPKKKCLEENNQVWAWCVCCSFKSLMISIHDLFSINKHWSQPRGNAIIIHHPHLG